MSNLDRFQYYSRLGYDNNFEEIYSDESGKLISKMWIINDNRKRIPNTTVFAAWEDDSDEGAEYNTLKEAKKAINVK